MLVLNSRVSVKIERRLAMADGIPCKHCGWQETEHDFPDLVEKYGDADPNQKVEGFKKSFYDCRCYVPQYRIKISQKEKDFEMAGFEREARSRAGWGMFSAVKRSIGLRDKLRKTGDNEEERERVLNKAREANHGLWIG